MSDFPKGQARPELLWFARYQLRNDDWAEDAVSTETGVVAALEKPQAFQRPFAAEDPAHRHPKHKLIDQLRRRAREVSATTDDDESDLDNLPFHERPLARGAEGMGDLEQ